MLPWFDTILLIPASTVCGAESDVSDFMPLSSIARLPDSGCRGKVEQVDSNVLDAIVDVVLVLEQVDNVGTHRLVLIPLDVVEELLRDVLDLVLDQVDDPSRLVVVEPKVVDHCSATMLNIE